MAAIADIFFNNSRTTGLDAHDDDFFLNSMSDENWEKLGSAITDNTHLTYIALNYCSLNDRKISSLFRGLKKSNIIDHLDLTDNDISTVGIRSMVPFLQNANNLVEVILDQNDLQTEGFNLLFGALRDSSIEELQCDFCGIESIEIDSDQIPRNLSRLSLGGNTINANGCRGLVKLLQGKDASPTVLDLRNNEIDDEGVEILVEALHSNIALKDLVLTGNEGISKQGEIMLLKLVNDISSIEATMQSNHTLTKLYVKGTFESGAREWVANDEGTFPGGRWVQKKSWVAGDEIQRNIDSALTFNRTLSDQGQAAVGKEKIIQTQLNSARRAVLCRLQEQEVEHSVFNEIDPLHLPEVLSLIGRSHGHGEFYVAMLSSIVSLFSTMDRERCIQQEKKNLIAQHEARLKELDNELAAIRELAAVRNNGNDVGHCSNKRRRT